MLDIQFIRAHRELLQQTADKKGIDLSIQALLELDEQRRRLRSEIDTLRHQRNRWSEQIGERIKQGEHSLAEQLKQQVRELHAELSAMEGALKEIESVGCPGEAWVYADGCPPARSRRCIAAYRIFSAWSRSGIRTGGRSEIFDRNF